MTGFLRHIRGHVLTLHHVIHTSLPMLYCRLTTRAWERRGVFLFTSTPRRILRARTWHDFSPMSMDRYNRHTSPESHHYQPTMTPFVPSTSKGFVCYRKVGNFWGKFFCKLVKNTIFAEKTFTDCSLLLCPRMQRPQISQRKVSRIATKSQNLCKFSPLNVSHFLVLSVQRSNVPVQHYAYSFPDIQ